MGKRGNKTKKTAANPYAARLSAVSPRKETRGNNGKHGATGQKLILFSVFFEFSGLLAQSIRLDCRQFAPLRGAGGRSGMFVRFGFRVAAACCGALLGWLIKNRLN